MRPVVSNISIGLNMSHGVYIGHDYSSVSAVSLLTATGSVFMTSLVTPATTLAVCRWILQNGCHRATPTQTKFLKRGSSAVECRTRNQVSPGSNTSLLPFRRLSIFVLSIDAPFDSAA